MERPVSNPDREPCRKCKSTEYKVVNGAFLCASCYAIRVARYRKGLSNCPEYRHKKREYQRIKREEARAARVLAGLPEWLGPSRKPIADFNINRSWYQYTVGARRRKIDFALTREQCRVVVLSNCYYCGSPPFRDIRKQYGKFKYPSDAHLVNGMDRLDSSTGYVDGNVVPCCTFCNLSKLERTEQEFVSWLDRVVENRLKKLGLKAVPIDG